MKTKSLVLPLLIIFFLLICLLIYLISKTPPAVPEIFEVSQTPSLSFEPASQTVGLDQTFTLNIVIDTGGQKTDGIEAIVVYDHDKLEFATASAQPSKNLFGPESTKILTPNPAPSSETGNVALGAASLDAAAACNGTFATITFKTIAEGTTNVTFSFDPEDIGATDGSNIAYEGADLLQSVSGASITIGGIENFILIKADLEDLKDASESAVKKAAVIKSKSGWAKTAVLSAAGEGILDITGLENQLEDNEELTAYIHPYLKKTIITNFTNPEGIYFPDLKTGDLNYDGAINTIDWSWISKNYQPVQE